MLFGFEAPVVIGPMNGGMDYPPGFARQRSAVVGALMGAGRASASLLNRLLPGKRRAATLLVANRPDPRRLTSRRSATTWSNWVENGVDLGLWRPVAATAADLADAVTTYVFMGRLVDWKAVDLLLEAFARARDRSPMRLWILGDGAERVRLEALAATLGIVGSSADTVGAVHFAGWLPQAECAERMAAADALVLPSLLECGGAVVLEAMSLAKPVIATAWGGPLDYLDPTCGVLIAPASRSAIIDGFAAAMVDLAPVGCLAPPAGGGGPRQGSARIRLGVEGRPHA